MAFSIDTGICIGSGFGDVQVNGYLAKLSNFMVRPFNPNVTNQIIIVDTRTMRSVEGPTFNNGDEVIWTADNGAVLPKGFVIGQSYFVGNFSRPGVYYVFSLFNSYTDAIANSNAIVNSSSGTGNFYLNVRGGGAAWVPKQTTLVDGLIQSMLFTDGVTSGGNDIANGQTRGAPKWVLIQKSAHAGQVLIQFYTSALYGSDAGMFVPVGLISGYLLNVLDGGNFVYDFRSGNGCLIIQSRIGTSWNTAGIDDFVSDPAMLEDETRMGQIMNPITAGASVTIPCNGTFKFTVGKWYYIFDAQTLGVFTCEYIQVEAVDTVGSTITVVSLNNNYPTAAIISSYPHCWFTFGDAQGNSGDVGINFDNGGKYSACLPYYSSANATFVSNSSGGAVPSELPVYGGIKGSVNVDALLTQAPGDDGTYLNDNPEICEAFRPQDNNATTQGLDMNRVYGKSKNLLMCSSANHAAGMDGEDDSDSNSLFFRTADELFAGGNPNIAVLFPDTVVSSDIP